MVAEKHTEQEMTQIEVTWLDAWSESFDLDKDGLKEMVSVPRKTIGYATREDENAIVLSSGVTEWTKIGKDKDTYTDNIVIPKISIIGITILREA